MAEAVAAGTASIENGVMSGDLPDDLIASMKERGIAYMPTLSVMDSMKETADQKITLYERPLVEQVGPPQ